MVIIEFISNSTENTSKEVQLLKYKKVLLVIKSSSAIAIQRFRLHFKTIPVFETFVWMAVSAFL